MTTTGEKMMDVRERQSEIDAAFAAYDCPGIEHCTKDRRTGEGRSIFPCADCKAPASIMLQNPPTKVYRSYSDYCDD